MIIEYNRPQTIAEALKLLERTEPVSVPLAGGTAINRTGEQPVAVVDLQALGLDKITPRGSSLEIGAMVTLQALLEESIPESLQRVIRQETTHNLRQAGTIGGLLVAAGGRSPLLTALLALDTVLTILPESRQVSLGDFLPARSERLHGRLISQVSIPLAPRLVFESVARTPADLPIVCVAAARWPSGRTRLALGGFGKTPSLAMDGSETAGAVYAAHNAYSEAADEWATAEYRAEIAGILAGRCTKILEDSR